MKLLEGKTAIVTGGSRGIGKGIVETFAKHGANVAFTYNSSAEAAEALADELSKEGVKVKAYKSDAANFDQAQELANEIDAFVRTYSGNILSKLISIGSFQRGESFEIQLKVRMNDAEKLDALLNHPAVEIVKHTRYRQYDTYFFFEGDDARVRYREDDKLDEDGESALKELLNIVGSSVINVFADKRLIVVR